MKSEGFNIGMNTGTVLVMVFHTHVLWLCHVCDRWFKLEGHKAYKPGQWKLFQVR